MPRFTVSKTKNGCMTFNQKSTKYNYMIHKSAWEAV